MNEARETRDQTAETLLLVGATLVGGCSALVAVAALLRWLASFFMVALVVLLLGGCGRHPSPPSRHFFLVVHNRTAQAEPMAVRPALDGVYTSPAVVQDVPGEGEATFCLGTHAPELVELAVSRAGWVTAWSGPEIRGGWVYHAYYPDGAITKGWSQ